MFLNKFDHSGYIPTCDDAASDTLTLLFIGFLMDYTLMLQNMGFATYDVPKFRNVYGTVIEL